MLLSRERTSGVRGKFRRVHPKARGFVFVPVDETTRGYYLAWLAYELCHTIGETDKYRGDFSVFPQGYAAPERLPLFPQTHSEIDTSGAQS